MTVEEFNRALDSVDYYFQTDNYNVVIERLSNLKVETAQPLSMAQEMRYWGAVYRTAFETSDYDLAIQAGITIYLHEWEHQPFDSWVPYRSIAHALKKAGDTAKAIAWYQRALEVHAAPERRDILSNLAELYAAKQEYTQALESVLRADTLHGLAGRSDTTSIAWSGMIKARCYAGLGRYALASTHLDQALDVLEHHQRAAEPYSQKDVRLSLYQSLWRDASILQRMGRQWTAFRQRIRRLYDRDSAELEAIGIPATRREQRTHLRIAISQQRSTSYAASVPRSLTELITSSVIDARGWKWVGTLKGLCIDNGGNLLAVAMPSGIDARRPIRSMHADTHNLYLQRFDCSVDTVAWNDLVDLSAMRQSKRLPVVYGRWIPWKARVPSALISLNDTSRVLVAHGNKVGVSTVSQTPKKMQAVRTQVNRVWPGRITCGIRLSDSVIIVGTNNGLGLLEFGSWTFTPVLAEPSYVNDATVTSIGRLVTGQYRVTYSYGDAFVFDTITADVHSRVTGRREDVQYMYESELAKRTPFVLTISNSIVRRDKTNPDVTPEMSIISPTVRVWIWNQMLHMHDLSTHSVSLHELPRQVEFAQEYHLASFVTGTGTFGVLDSNGLFLGHTLHDNTGYGARMLAYRTHDGGHFHIAAEGVTDTIREQPRYLELITDRTALWSELSIRQQIRASWSGEERTTLVQRPTVFREIPHGRHEIHIQSGDRADPMIMHVVVMPTMTETALFKLLITIGIIVLVVTWIQYIRLLRKNRALFLENAMNLERTRMGQDVHDAIGSDLVRIGIIARAIPSATHRAEVTRLTREASRTLRDIIWSVNDNHTLDALIAVTIERVRAIGEESGLHVVVSVPPVIDTHMISSKTVRDIVLILTEAVTNVVKHANATRITYRVECEGGQYMLCIDDDGQGFDASQTSDGLGLHNMRSRAYRSGLTLDVRTSVGKGTTISLTMTAPTQ